MTESHVRRRGANVVGAFATLVQDRMRGAAEAAAPYSGAAAAALVTIATHERCTIERLARALGVTHSGAVRVVDRLARGGLARREPGPDARSVGLSLTPEGRDRTARVLEARRDALMEILDGLDERDVEAMVAVVERVLTGITDDRPTADAICRLCDETDCVPCPVDAGARKSG
jgi:DNA-binding MarR family transcriptional regulator